MISDKSYWFVQTSVDLRCDNHGSAQRLRTHRGVNCLPLLTISMFKKQLATKTEAPLRGSDRRKLRASVVAKFHLEPQQVDAGSSAPTPDSDDGVANLLVPEGIRSTKYTNSTGETGVNTCLFLNATGTACSSRLCI